MGINLWSAGIPFLGSNCLLTFPKRESVKISCFSFPVVYIGHCIVGFLWVLSGSSKSIKEFKRVDKKWAINWSSDNLVGECSKLVSELSQRDWIGSCSCQSPKQPAQTKRKANAKKRQKNTKNYWQSPRLKRYEKPIRNQIFLLLVKIEYTEKHLLTCFVKKKKKIINTCRHILWKEKEIWKRRRR